MVAARNHLNGLQICYTNARSLFNKRSDLSTQIDSTRPEIINVTKNPLSQSEDSEEINFGNFTLVRAERTQKFEGGRVALSIKNTIPLPLLITSHESEICETA